MAEVNGASIPPPMPASQVLDREFLGMRARVLELAATLDRLERAPGGVASDRRMTQLRAAIQVLLEHDRGERAEAVQRIFSRSYDPQWRTTLGVQAAD
jgi:hypothetical protein